MSTTACVVRSELISEMLLVPHTPIVWLWRRTMGKIGPQRRSNISDITYYTTSSFPTHNIFQPPVFPPTIFSNLNIFHPQYFRYNLLYHLPLSHPEYFPPSIFPTHNISDITYYATSPFPTSVFPTHNILDITYYTTSPFPTHNIFHP